LIAHVEPTDERGRSRWLGEGQFLSYRVCQSIKRILATEIDEDHWSRRAAAAMRDVRNEHPWVALGSTSVLRHANGETLWWTFAGGVANTLIAGHLKAVTDIATDNLTIRLRGAEALDRVEELVGPVDPEGIEHSPDAIDGLKFSEALPSALAAEVLCARFADPQAINAVLTEPRRFVVPHEDNHRRAGLVEEQG
jgi:ATP-dependent Lhr-like helicase